MVRYPTCGSHAQHLVMLAVISNPSVSFKWLFKESNMLSTQTPNSQGKLQADYYLGQSLLKKF